MNINDNDIIQIPRKELNCQIENFKRAVSQRNKIEKENQKLQKRIATLEKYREEPQAEVVRLQNCNCEFKKENKKLKGILCGLITNKELFYDDEYIEWVSKQIIPDIKTNQK